MDFKKYEKPSVELTEIKMEGRILASSIETINKEFNVKTGVYEVEEDAWYSGTATFDYTDFQ